MMKLRASAVSHAILTLAATCLLGAAVGGPVNAQTPAPAPAAAAAPVTAPAPAKPRNFALVSAVGDQFQYVRQKESVGSNFIDHFVRKTLVVPDHALNYAVLRGLDRAVAQEYPDSERVLLAMRGVPDIQNALPQDREALTMQHVLSVLEANPARKDWDQIIVVVPKWLMSERQGMGGKLTGIGEFVTDDVNGYLADDDVELVRRLVTLAVHPSVRSRMTAYNLRTEPAQGWANVVQTAEAEYARALTLAR